MKKTKLLNIFLLVFAFNCFTAFGANSTIDSSLYKIDKSFNLYGAVFKTLVNNYVIGLDPEFIMREGIKGILSSLDPYTTLYDNNEDQDYEILVDGSYVGFGISVGPIDSLMTISEVMEGFPAKKAGLKIGDIIYKIDSTVVINLSSAELRKYTNGKPGSKSNVYIIRSGILDTLKYEILREDIKLSSVSYSGMFNDSIGIIKFESFSVTSYEEFKNAYSELKKKNKLKGLVIDLRNNPGGYLESAVKICEMFVPKNTLIVSTKGQYSQGYEYRSINEPVDLNLPLAILINSSSASASEIVSGAMQDLDRAVILGERSFGKGLVQTIIDLPYSKSLKITSAKYYIPSGRCIQRINYDIDGRSKIINSPNIDSIFYTSNKREVKEQNGIKPDIEIQERENEFLINLLVNNVIFGFVNKYTATARSINFTDELSDSTFQQFVDFYRKELRNPKKNYLMKNNIQNSLISLNKLLADTSISQKTKREITETRNSLIDEELNFTINKKDIIKEKLHDEIIYRYNTYKEYTKHLFIKDAVINKAVLYLREDNYNKILSKKNDKI